MEEISDGKLYSGNDMVKADCHGCAGCSACCHGMGKSIVLDPYDIWQLEAGLHVSFEELLSWALELGVVDGVVLPNLRMAGEEEACPFLDSQGRCSVHGFRPGFCRLFPLGRIYENGSFQYFLQTHECPQTDRTKIKVRKWIGVPDFGRYEKFVNDWHYFLKGLQEQVMKDPGSEQAREISLGVLKEFYLRPYEDGRDFYEQFYERLLRGKAEG